MGQNNRHRRAMKKRQRDARHRAPTPSSSARTASPSFGPHAGGTSTTFRDDGHFFHDDGWDDLGVTMPDSPLPGRSDAPESTLVAVGRLAELIEAVAADRPVDGHRRRFLALAEVGQRAALELSLRAGVERALESGWTPFDLYELGRRRANAGTASYLVHVCAEWTKRFPASTVHPRWTEQLRDLGRGNPRGEPSLRQWAAGRVWADEVAGLTDLAVAVMMLPGVEPVLPAPGSDAAAVSAPSGVDESVLRRVRGLLAKAEATEFEDEAAALSAKAQSLMTRHSIDSAMAAAPSTVRETPQVRRVWLDAPYVRAKALLVSEVATANHCRTVLTEKFGFVTLLGFGVDLDTTDLLSTSLLVQATRAIRQTGSQRTAWGTSRTRAYRQSFLVSFATRIGERLSEAAAATESAVDAERGGALLPVLASRQLRVNAAFEKTFAQLRSMSLSASDQAGWGEGRSAADLADLNVRPEVDRRSA